MHDAFLPLSTKMRWVLSLIRFVVRVGGKCEP